MEKVTLKTPFGCKICDKLYSSKRSLYNHNKKFHCNPDVYIDEKKVTFVNQKVTCEKNNQLIKNEIFNCKYCNKKYLVRQSCWKHEKTCNKIKPFNQMNNTLNNIANNSTINSNNKIIQNIYINGFTKENIRVLSLENIKDIYNQNKNCLIKFIEYINFSEKTPENHTFCNTSLEGNYVSVADEKTKSIQKINKFDCYDRILDTTVNNIDSMLDFIKDKMKPLQYHKFRKLIEDTKLSYLSNKKSKEIYNTQINQLAYNNREMVLKTWKHAVFKDNNIVIEDEEDSEDDDSDSDNLFKKGYDLNDKVFDDDMEI